MFPPQKIDPQFNLHLCSDCVADFRKKHDGNVLVGCGTIMDVEDAQRALEAGAEFIVCPILIPEVGSSSSRNESLVSPVPTTFLLLRLCVNEAVVVTVPEISNDHHYSRISIITFMHLICKLLIA